eukprot:6944160-Ditylum_brightwellii.AAC.1
MVINDLTERSIQQKHQTCISHVTPKKSDVSSSTDNIDFDMSHSNETNNETQDNKSEVLETSNDTNNNSRSLLPDDMKYIGIEEWA